jgi:tRNA-dihydrouridine synthase
MDDLARVQAMVETLAANLSVPVTCKARPSRTHTHTHTREQKTRC